MIITKKNAIFPGTFSPIHVGHLNIIKRASFLFDNLFVVVSINCEKNNTSHIDKRLEEAKKEIRKLNLKNVFVLKNDGLTIDFAKKYDCKYIIRSIRNPLDLKYELDLAQSNHFLNNDIETILYIANDKLKDISSTKINNIKKTVINIKEAKW